jgi:RecJ-like exonuclease
MLTCRDCQGTGQIEVFDCGMPASQCCGGCTKYYTCGNCGGTGQVEFEHEDLLNKAIEYINKQNKIKDENKQN